MECENENLQTLVSAIYSVLVAGFCGFGRDKN